LKAGAHPAECGDTLQAIAIFSKEFYFRILQVCGSAFFYIFFRTSTKAKTAAFDSLFTDFCC